MTVPSVVSATELLVDFFLEYQEEEKAEFSFEGCVEEVDPIPPTHTVDANQELFKRKFGAELAAIGDEINEKYKKVAHKSLQDNVKEFFEPLITSGDGKPEEFWPKFRDLQDSAIKDTGLDNAKQIIAAVLFSVKGLGYLGSCVREVTMRYIRERHLDNDIIQLKEKDPNPHVD